MYWVKEIFKNPIKEKVSIWNKIIALHRRNTYKARINIFVLSNSTENLTTDNADILRHTVKCRKYFTNNLSWYLKIYPWNNRIYVENKLWIFWSFQSKWNTFLCAKQ